MTRAGSMGARRWNTIPFTVVYGIAATDVRTLIVVAAGVLAFGVLASYLPARRAATLDPCTMFREE